MHSSMPCHMFFSSFENCIPLIKSSDFSVCLKSCSLELFCIVGNGEDCSGIRREAKRGSGKRETKEAGE